MTTWKTGVTAVAGIGLLTVAGTAMPSFASARHTIHARHATSARHSAAWVGAEKRRLDAHGAWDIVGRRPAMSPTWVRTQQSRLAAAQALVAGRLTIATARTALGTAPDVGTRTLVDMLRAGSLAGPDGSGTVSASRSSSSPTTGTSPTSTTAHVPAQAVVKGDQTAQIRNYWCGPAATFELLRQVGIRHISQGGMATALRTTSNGTAWSGVYVATKPSTGYPIPDVLNHRLSGRAHYAPVTVHYTPTASDIKDFTVRLRADIATGWPLIGNAYEVPGGPHLTGHPANYTIFHYFDIRGYRNNGATTRYEDTVHGATSISWSTQVPAYSSLPTKTIATIVGGRGYVW